MCVADRLFGEEVLEHPHERFTGRLGECITLVERPSHLFVPAVGICAIGTCVGGRIHHLDSGYCACAPASVLGHNPPTRKGELQMDSGASR